MNEEEDTRNNVIVRFSWFFYTLWIITIIVLLEIANYFGQYFIQ